MLLIEIKQFKNENEKKKRKDNKSINLKLAQRQLINIFVQEAAFPGALG